MSSKECGRGVFVRRMAWVLGVCLAVAVFLTGCELIRIEEGERTPVEYAIVKQEELPDEAVEFIEQRKKKEFQMIYLVGDGEQMTGGYSIQVEEVSESENGVFCKTRLIGPSEGNQGGEPSYPCIVLKIKKTGKPVQFTG